MLVSYGTSGRSVRYWLQVIKEKKTLFTGGLLIDWASTFAVYLAQYKPHPLC